MKFILVFCLIFIAGCSPKILSTPSGRAPGRDRDFVPSKIRLQPSFSRLKTGAGGYEIEAYLELSDQFGDPIKSLGKVRFEIYHYLPAYSDPRGQRFLEDGVQEVDLSNLQVNQQYWFSTSRSYQLRIKAPPLGAEDQKIVLQVTFTTPDDYRLQDMLILERKK